MQNLDLIQKKQKIKVGLFESYLRIIDESNDRLYETPKNAAIINKTKNTDSIYNFYEKENNRLISLSFKALYSIPIENISPLNSEFTAFDPVSFELWYTNNIGVISATVTGTTPTTPLPEYNFSITPNLINNTANDYVEPIVGVLAANTYVLISEGTYPGVTAILDFWQNGQVFVNIENNSGTTFNTTMNFRLKQV